MRTTEGDRNITVAEESLPSDEYFTTIVKMTYQHISNLHYYMFVCAAYDPKSLLESDISFLLAEVAQTNVDMAHALPMTVEVGDTVTIPLPGEDNLFYVWKKMQSPQVFEVIAHGFLDGENRGQTPYRVDHEGALVITKHDITQDGSYVCYASDGINEEIAVYNITRSGTQIFFLRVVIIKCTFYISI